jgi:hypothetical protein
MRLGSELSDEEVKIMSSELTTEPDIYVMQRATYPSLHRNINIENITNIREWSSRKSKIKEGSTMGRLSLAGNEHDVILPTSVLIRPYAFYLDGKIETLPIGLVKCANGSTFGSIFECTLKDMLVLK